MTVVRIEFDITRCVGALRCTHEAPFLFSKDGSKARLDQAALAGDVFARGLSLDAPGLERAKKAALSCPVNAIRIIDTATNLPLVRSSLAIAQDVKVIRATYDDAKEFVMDPRGYFLIRVLPQESLIEVGFCKERNEICNRVVGRTPVEIYQTVLREAIIVRADHAAYLGRELQKAAIALALGIPYVQDSDLDLSAVKPDARR